MKIGIVILNYNDYEKTIECANHIIHYSSIDYIVIVDNGSSNQSFKQISDFSNLIKSPKLKVIKSDVNGGYASGNNIGINYLLNNTDSDIIGIVNPDIFFENILGEQIKEQFRNHPNFAILTGMQTDKHGNVSKRAFWRELTVLQFIISMSPTASKLQNLLFGDYVIKKLKKSNGEIVEVPTVEGCLFFIRASIFRKTGGFDEGTFLFMEEDILASKTRKLGLKIGVIKDVRFIHDHSATIGKFISYLNRVKIMNKSKRYYFCKYLFEGKTLGTVLFTGIEAASWLEQIFIMVPYVFIKGRFMKNN